jgi:hypothetical protein
MQVDPASFPAGDPYTAALGVVHDHFYYENPSEGWFTFVYPDVAAPSLGNTVNEVWFADDPYIYDSNCFRWISGATLEVIEADVVFRVTAPFTTSYSKSQTWAYGGPYRPFETATIHELLCAVGLMDEDDEFSVMGPDWDHVHVNGNTYRSYIGEDGSAGMLDLFGPYTGGQIENVGVTARKYKGTTGGYSTHEWCVVTDSAGVPLPTNGAVASQPRYEVTNGQSIRAEFSLENMGESTQTVTIRYYLSIDTTISTTDTLVSSTTRTLSVNDVLTYRHPLTLPNNLNENQTYYLGAIIDPDNVIAEPDEGWNTAFTPIRVVCDLPAYSYYYNAGTNLPTLTCSLFEIGKPYWINVNVGAAGHTHALAFAYKDPVELDLGNGVTLLTWGSQELLGLAWKAGPIVGWVGTVPDNHSLCGLTFSVQAVHWSGGFDLSLSNVQDLRLGH